MEAERGFAAWAVERKDTGDLIGNCGLQPVERVGPEIELAYHYVKTSWNHGFGTEAAVGVLGHALGPLGLERIIAICIPENIGSWRVMEKAGMRYEGIASYYGLAGLKKYVADRATWRMPT
jgi:ribosomal-protein-alanine N-acetyltransferase